MPKGPARALGADEMFAARWEYETTPISQGGLAHRYGISQPLVFKYAKANKWKKRARKALKRYPDTPEGHASYEADLVAAMQLEYDRLQVEGLSAELAASTPKTDPSVVHQVVRDIQKKADMRLAYWEKRHPRKTGRHKWPLAAKPEPPPAAESEADEADPDDAAPAEPKRDRKKRRDHSRAKNNHGMSGGDIVAFPGSYTAPAPPRPLPAVVPQIAERAEQAALKLQLAGLRGELTMQAIRAMGVVDQVVDEYGHVLSVFLNPRRYVDPEKEGLDEERAKERLRDISVAAARIVLPTERDTLHAAVTSFTRAKIACVTTQRDLLGIAGKNGRTIDGKADDFTEEVETKTAELMQLDIETLRRVRSVMDELTGQVQRQQEPPKPPPPDEIADLAAVAPAMPPKPPPPI